jgi:hypothetical protein
MPVPIGQAFVFTGDSKPTARASTLKEFFERLVTQSDVALAGHLRRHDFSRWIDDVFRDRPLAAHLRSIEGRIQRDEVRDVADAVGQAIRARYDIAATAGVISA